MDSENNQFDKPFEPAAQTGGSVFGAKDVFSDETKQSAEATLDKAKSAGDDLKGAAQAASHTARTAADDIGRAAADIGTDARATLDHRLQRLAKDISANPFTSVAIAATVGYVFAALRGRRY